MSLVPRGNFFDPDRFMNDFFAPVTREGESAASFFAPRVDIKDLENRYEITAELPGISKDDIHVNLSDGVLTLEAELNEDNTEKEKGKVIRRERRYGKFMRTFSLGGDVQESDIVARFKDGVLLLEVPKAKETQPKQRRIDIK